jgi:uncharacterized membrane protein YozB (DUF420 family)
MNIPTFSVFSAISEVFVTIAVLYAIVTALKGKRFQKELLGATLLFELCINVVYMAGRASHADTSSTLTTAMKAFYAGHGILSLLMFLGLMVVYLLALADDMKGREIWFRRHRPFTYVFLFFWMVSVISGEAIFYITYLAPSSGAA